MMKTGLTFDGLFLAGARGNGTMDSLIGGIGVMLGPNSKILNCEITSCDIGVMMSGEGSLMQGCYIHDLIMGVDDAPGIDPNLVGGAEGIFVNASNCEVAYNSFVNCTGPAKWVGDNGGCDGGAVEITATSGKVLSGVKFHHNFALNCCGFFEVNTTFGGKGTVSNTEFYSNLIIDCGWMGLLQVNNTWLKNIHYTNNTLIQHKGSVNSGIFFIIYTDTSSGLAGGQLDPNTVFLTNNLFVLDSVTTYNTLFDSNFVQSGNLVVKTKEKNPGFVNLKGTNSSDFTLTEASPAHGTGTAVTQNILDFFNRPMKNPSTPDIGAFQIGTSQTDCIPRLPFFDNAEITISKKIQSSSKAIYTNSEINVSLNPLTSILTITNRTNLNSSTQLKVYNIQGKRLYETLFEGNKPISRMDMSPFKPGIYFVKIQSGSQEYMQQIAKR
jgi:hypothetical protein